MVAWTMLPCDKGLPPKPLDMPSVDGALAHITSHLGTGRYALKDRVDLAALAAHSGNKYTQHEMIPDGEFAQLRELSGVTPLVLLPPGAGTASVVGTDGVVAFYDKHGDLKGLPPNERCTFLAKAAGFNMTLRGDVFIGRLAHAAPSDQVSLGAEVAPQLIMERSWLEAAQAYQKSGAGACALQGVLEASLVQVRRAQVAAAVQAKAASALPQAPSAPKAGSDAPAAPAIAPAVAPPKDAPTPGAAAPTSAPAEAAGADAADFAMTWEDATNEVTVRVANLPGGTKAKHVRATIKDESIHVDVGTLPAGKGTVVSGELFQKVNANECTWAFEDEKDGTRTLVVRRQR